MRKILLTMILAVAVSLLPFGSGWIAQANSKDNEKIPFQMLAVNDFHGNLDTVGEFDENGKSVKVGGAPISLLT